MGDHHPGIGVRREDEGQGGEVGGRLDDPARRRPLGHPLQRLELTLVPVVNRGLVHAAAPHRVVGHVVQPRVHVTRELVGEGEDALGREAAAVLVHGGEGGHHLVHERDLVVAQVAGRILVGDAVEQLPQQRWAVVGVAGEQLVQQRRPGAPEAGHHDGGMHRLSEDGRLPFPELDHAEPVLEDELDLPRVRSRPGRCRRASASSDAQSRRKGSSHQSSPKSSRPVVETAAARRSSGASEINERPSSPRPRPSETILSVHGLRGGGSQGTGRHRTRNGGGTGTWGRMVP